MVRITALVLGFGLMAAPALADLKQAVEGQLTPGYAAFAKASADLAAAADKDCSPEAVKPAWNAAYDAWLAVSFFHLGPVEDDGRALAIHFWPDPKGLGAKAQRALLSGDAAALEPAAFADQSVAARGLMGLERLLYPDTPFEGDACPLIRATASDLARMASGVNADWPAYAATLLTAGEPGNTAFLSPQEALQALFTQGATGLEAIVDQQLGRPLGSFDKPHPERAESGAAGRSQRNVALMLQALRGFAAALDDKSVLTLAGLDRAVGLAEKLDDPAFAAVGDPQGHLRVEIVQQAVKAARDTMIAEMAPALGVDLGFNSQDGD
ncbi:imelysin family protein [Fuscibacter oryzae]|nr:imelysin family protein [Fuscibacter oryzae]